MLSFSSLLILPSHCSGEQGWCSGDRTRLPPMWPGFNSRTRWHKWIEFIVGSRISSEGFSPGSTVFLPPQKSTFLNSNSIRNTRATGLSVVWLLCVTLVKTKLIYLFIYLFIYSFALAEINVWFTFQYNTPQFFKSSRDTGSGGSSWCGSLWSSSEESINHAFTMIITICSKI